MSCSGHQGIAMITGASARTTRPGSPGAAAGFCDAAGVLLANGPAAVPMSAEDMVDAALAGLDQGEVVTIPPLPGPADWAAFEAARQALVPSLSRAEPAARYGMTRRRAA